MSERLIENIETTVIAVVAGLIAAVFSHFLNFRKAKNEEVREMKRKAYSELLDSSRAFMDDPNLSPEQVREAKRKFIAKYYNEIILFADKDVQLKIESFIKTGGVSSAKTGTQVSKLKDMITSIRTDLGFEKEVLEEFKMYSLDIEDTKSTRDTIESESEK